MKDSFSEQGTFMLAVLGPPWERNRAEVGYRGRRLWSVEAWPFSLKLLWAPLVDCPGSHSFVRGAVLLAWCDVASVMRVCRYNPVAIRCSSIHELQPRLLL